MKYTKPEVTFVGEAVAVILGTKNQVSTDSSGAQPANAIPAYELDE